MGLSGQLGVQRRAKVQKRAFGLQSIWDEGGRSSTFGTFGYAILFVSHAARSIILSPLHALLTILTGAVVLFFLGAFILIFSNTGSLVERRAAAEGASIFLKDTASNEDVAALRAVLARMPEVESAAFVSKAEALTRFRESLGDARSALEGLDEKNPLPASFELSFVPGAGLSTSEMALRLKGEAAIEKIVLDEALLGQLAGLLDTLRWIGILGGVALFVMMAFVIASTIRLALHADRQEISIMRLVGARSSFVNAPFIIQGAVQGFFGGLLGVAALYGAFHLFRHTLEEVGTFNLLFPEVNFLPLWLCVFLVAGGLIIGILGSYFTVSRFGREGEFA